MKRNKRNAFTLVEIMIVVLIIGILLAIAVPNFIKARETSRNKTIAATLSKVDAANEQCAMDEGLDDGDTCATLGDYLVEYPPNFPINGTFDAGSVGSGAPATFNGDDAQTWSNK